MKLDTEKKLRKSMKQRAVFFVCLFKDYFNKSVVKEKREKTQITIFRNEPGN